LKAILRNYHFSMGTCSPVNKRHFLFLRVTSGSSRKRHWATFSGNVNLVESGHTGLVEIQALIPTCYTDAILNVARKDLTPCFCWHQQHSMQERNSAPLKVPTVAQTGSPPTSVWQIRGYQPWSSTRWHYLPSMLEHIMTCSRA